jgi:hypothetical protein
MLKQHLHDHNEKKESNDHRENKVFKESNDHNERHELQELK